MNEWEARYKALLAGIRDKETVNNAEALVKKAIDLSNISNLSFEETLSGLLMVAGLLQSRSQANKNLQFEGLAIRKENRPH